MKVIQISEKHSTAYLGAGCFWCTEAVFQELEGVICVSPGFSGGSVENPSYEQVCTGTTGHAEVARIVFDPETISFGRILDVFFSVHDPTSLNRQGADVGEQYRSVIFYTDDEQFDVAKESIGTLTEQKVFDKPIVTALEKFTAFYPAEDYHHDYFRNNPDAPYCQYVISPKVAKFRKKHGKLLKKPEQE
ncbi:MAG: peptide-methionine (S)-S-oxide reductase MsrA [Candidatus Thermoplasmatota archaeon]|jgi:peptide-methionine (S)-S-oxide reductase|nr:peptide-methionine (S)-S-oxide reductase MsrA [Candidatus Thermoplasmatota archaeon]MCL5438334.1 peptide-methionine (S)-S-oxide reductase MsrA [Candidatus Thermoplasmatota archaeon]